MSSGEQTHIDAGLLGTESQRRYARKLVKAAKESDIKDYVQHRRATIRLHRDLVVRLLRLDQGVDSGHSLGAAETL